MGFFSRLPFAKKRNLSVAEAFGEVLIGAASGRTKGPISAETAGKVAAVHACKLGIAESVAMLPGTTLEQAENGDRNKLKDHWLTRLLRDGPSDITDPFVYFESQTYNLLDDGNAYSFIERKRSKEVHALVPLLPKNMRVEVSAGNRLKYFYRDPKGSEIEYEASDILHVKYLSKDGILGRSPLAVACDPIRGAYSLLEHMNSFFENGAFNSGFLKVPFEFADDEQRKSFVDSFKAVFGSRNAGKVGLLEKSAEWIQAMQNMQQAQFAELRALSVIDIAMIYRMPPHMIQYLKEGASYSSIEQQSLNFVTYTIQPWVTRWEMALRKQLLLEDDPAYYVKFNVDALVRGDLASRTAAIVSQITNGLKTLNEGRALFDENRITDPLADQVMVSHNARPLSQVNSAAGDKGERPTAPAEDPKPADDEVARFLPLFEDAEARIEKRESELLAYAIRNNKAIGEIEKSYKRFHASASEILEPLCIAARVERSKLDAFLELYIDSRFGDVRVRGASIGVPKGVMNLTGFAKSFINGGRNAAAT